MTSLEGLSADETRSGGFRCFGRQESLAIADY